MKSRHLVPLGAGSYSRRAAFFFASRYFLDRQLPTLPIAGTIGGVSRKIARGGQSSDRRNAGGISNLIVDEIRERLAGQAFAMLVRNNGKNWAVAFLNREVSQ